MKNINLIALRAKYTIEYSAIHWWTTKHGKCRGLFKLECDNILKQMTYNVAINSRSPNRYSIESIFFMN